MNIEPLQEDAAAYEAWDRFIPESNNGTMFHRLRFLAYHPAERFCSHHLVVTKRGRLFALLPAVVRKEKGGRALVSHPGASYGGPVLPMRFRFHEATVLVSRLLEYAWKAGFARIELTLTPTPYMRAPHQTLEFALVQAGFGYRKRELTQIVPLDAAPDDIVRRLPAGTRADIRQARKFGLRVAWSDDPSDDELAALYRMLIDNRRQLGLSAPPTHTPEELRRIRDLMPGCLTLGTAYTANHPAATTLVFRCNPQALLTFYICHDRTYRDRHPVHLLLADLLREGRRQGCRIVDFGISTVNMAPLRSLIRFKESFRAQGFFRETFEIGLQPDSFHRPS